MEASGQMPSPEGAGPPSGGHGYPLTFSVDYPDREQRASHGAGRDERARRHPVRAGLSAAGRAGTALT
jgi:hypothetical protein